MVETQRESDMADDGVKLGPVEYFNMLERIMYNRRWLANFANFDLVNQ